MTIKEIECKSILVKSKLPDAEYVVNPYTGCAFGCLYCYASFMGRFVNERIDNWGNYIYAKVNAVSVFEQDLIRLRRSDKAPSVLLSSVTDPYQGAETKYRLTRGILEVFARAPYPGVVSILTKSPLVLRDVDLLRRLPRAEVGMTITTTDDKISRFLEVRAPLASRRFETLAELHAQGLTTYAFVGPLLPHFRYNEKGLDSLFGELAHAHVGSIYVEHMNLKPYIRERLFPIVEQEPANVQAEYRGAARAEHRDALNQMVVSLLARYDLKLRFNKVLYHNN
ncbi:MAG: radical SAM protein [Deltaproteobacteria bacterium]|nr:radical SAM protein [Deltaproteobacteria bacterium]